jgi:hypothetical protein
MDVAAPEFAASAAAVERTPSSRGESYGAVHSVSRGQGNLFLGVSARAHLRDGRFPSSWVPAENKRFKPSTR